MNGNLFNWKKGGHEMHNTVAAKDLQISCEEQFY
jgi:hypothetical protein